MATLSVVFGLIVFYCLYLFITLLNWLDSEWQSITSFLFSLFAVVVAFISIVAVTVFIRKWIKSQLVSNEGCAEHPEGMGLKILVALIPVVAVVTLARTAFIGYAVVNTLNHMSAVGMPEEIIGPNWRPWHFIPVILINVLMAFGAVMLLKRKAAMVLFFGLAFFLASLNFIYQMLRDLDNADFILVRMLPGLILHALLAVYGSYLLKRQRLW
ncbi:MAG TPA: hypothetical protein VIC26_04275 [Marinagarivorans sp.]